MPYEMTPRDQALTDRVVVFYSRKHANIPSPLRDFRTEVPARVKRAIERRPENEGLMGSHNGDVEVAVRADLDMRYPTDEVAKILKRFQKTPH